MIIGIGVDIIDVGRIQKLAEENPRFLKRVFTPEEIEYCSGKANRYQHLAARFAAKEAVSKALGTGMGKVRPIEMEVVQDENRAPHLQLHGEALRVAQSLGLHTWSISLSHSEQHAVAFVVAIGE